MYADVNFKTKKELKQAVKDGRKIGVHQSNGDIFGVEPPKDGEVTLEGPHYPEPHRWYARVELKNGFIKKVKQ